MLSLLLNRHINEPQYVQRISSLIISFELRGPSLLALRLDLLALWLLARVYFWL